MTPKVKAYVERRVKAYKRAGFKGIAAYGKALADARKKGMWKPKKRGPARKSALGEVHPIPEKVARYLQQQRHERGWPTPRRYIQRTIPQSRNPSSSYSDVSCPVCGGEGVPLGSLGRRQHFRCRQCGMDFSITPRS